MSSDKHEVALMANKRLIVFSLSDFAITAEYELKGDYRRVVIISGMGVLLQTKYNLHYLELAVKGGICESCVFELKKPGIKGILNLEQPAVDVLHIDQYSLICVTSNNCSFFVDYQFRQYVRYPSVRHPSEPMLLYFLHPCYLLGFYSTSFCTFLVHTGECLQSTTLNSIDFELSSSSYSHCLIGLSDSLVSFSAPSLDLLITSILSRQRFEIALEICRDTCHSMISRVYFEHAVHMFFQERDYQRASYYFRKSEETWAVCSLLRKILVLPPVVYNKCQEMFDLAIKRISKFSIMNTHFDFIKQKHVLSYDYALKLRIVQNFIPFFTMIRKTDDELLKFFAESWLFAGFLFLPTGICELLAILRDTNNVLPLRYCESVLKSLNKAEELTELFISRKIYKTGLDYLFSKYEEDRRNYWLVKIQDFLMQVTSNCECFIQSIQRLFCLSSEHAEQLLLNYPKILKEINVLEVLIPIMFKYSGTKLVINFLKGRDSLEESNFLAKLFIQEAYAGNVNPKDLLTFLSTRPIKYDPAIVLNYFPSSTLQRERCLVLDLLGKYEEIIHYYLYKEKNMDIAKKYVEFKRNPEVSGIFLTKICKPPMSSEATETLISFLNDSNPSIIDLNIVSAI